MGFAILTVCLETFRGKKLEPTICGRDHLQKTSIVLLSLYSTSWRLLIHNCQLSPTLSSPQCSSQKFKALYYENLLRHSY